MFDLRSYQKNINYLKINYYSLNLDTFLLKMFDFSSFK